MKDNSGPAFPGTKEIFSDVKHEWIFVPTDGMTKRELIAMSQMQILRDIYPGMKPRDIAKNAVIDADALLAELAKE